MKPYSIKYSPFSGKWEVLSGPNMAHILASFTTSEAAVDFIEMKAEDDEQFPCGHMQRDEDGDCIDCGYSQEAEADMDDFEARLSEMRVR